MQRTISEQTHAPHVIVRQSCANTCQQLRVVLEQAEVVMHAQPDRQEAIVCAKEPLVGCGAHNYNEGHYAVDDDEQATLLENPSRYESFLHGASTVAVRIERAIQAGAVQHDDLPSL